MTIRFSPTVSRGAAKGEPMEPWKDADGNFVLFDPAKRSKGSVQSEDCVRARSAEQARRLVEENGYSMRMMMRGSRTAPSMIRAARIEVVDAATDL